jgi:transposase-like protein
MAKRVSNRKMQCYALFQKHPRSSVAQLCKRYGIPESTMYKWKQEWIKEKNKQVANQIKQIVQLEDAQHQVPVDPTNGGETTRMAIFIVAVIVFILTVMVLGHEPKV